MATIRATARCKVRSTPVTRNGVSAKTNKEWSVREVEVIDGDDNKLSLTLRDGLAIEFVVGKTYDFALDVETDYRVQASCRVVDVRPVG
jgi:hypothetical protein